MSERYLRRSASLLELTTQQMAMLLLKLQTQPRSNQKQYMQDLGGTGTTSELDEALAIGRRNQDAVDEAEVLLRGWERECFSDASPISRGVCQAVGFFVSSLVSGDFGPDDSRDGRSDAFLKHPHIVARTTEIFLERLRVDRGGSVINHDEAERHARDFLDDHLR